MSIFFNHAVFIYSRNSRIFLRGLQQVLCLLFTQHEKKRTFVRYIGVPHTQHFGSYFYSPVGKQLPSLHSHTIIAVLPTDGL